MSKLSEGLEELTRQKDDGDGMNYEPSEPFEPMKKPAGYAQKMPGESQNDEELPF